MEEDEGKWENEAGLHLFVGRPKIAREWEGNFMKLLEEVRM